MPRSATDATRFTSTTPHATAIPQSTVRFQDQQKKRATPGPSGETPLEKVRRLRAAADRAKDAQVSTMDKMIIRGRVWADIAHRTTTLFLIGCTVVAGGVTVYALGDMIIYNRKKRAQFYAEQKAIHQNARHNAEQALAAGTATEKEIEFLRREEEHDKFLEEKERKKAEKKGFFKRGKELLFWGLSKGEAEVTPQAVGGDNANPVVHEVDQLRDKGNPALQSLDRQKTHVVDSAKQAFADERARQNSGGPLDQLGTKSSDAEAPKSGGWTSWMIRR